MFGKLFGNNKPAPNEKILKPSLTRGIQDLRSAAKNLEKREEHLQTKVNKSLKNAKSKSRKKDKKGALFELKKKKMLENQLQSIQGKRINVETQIMALEDAHLNTETLKAMKSSSRALKQTVKESDLEKVDELMEEMNEVMEQVKEMDEAMQQPLGPIFDDDELQAELDELDNMEADELLIEANQNEITSNQDLYGKQIQNLPNPPQNKVAQQEVTEEEEELMELEAMME